MFPLLANLKILLYCLECVRNSIILGDKKNNAYCKLFSLGNSHTMLLYSLLHMFSVQNVVLRDVLHNRIPSFIKGHTSREGLLSRLFKRTNFTLLHPTLIPAGMNSMSNGMSQDLPVPNCLGLILSYFITAWALLAEDPSENIFLNKYFSTGEGLCCSYPIVVNMFAFFQTRLPP